MNDRDRRSATLRQLICTPNGRKALIEIYLEKCRPSRGFFANTPFNTMIEKILEVEFPATERSLETR